MLTFDEYKVLGGKADETAFPSLLRKAIQKLNYFTLNKAKECPEVKVCLYEFIEAMNGAETNTEGVSSFTNGNVTVNFESGHSTDTVLYQIAEETLPIEMLSRVVNQ